ncbi:putative cytochrome P450 [Trypanosoma cruzi]|nr:putative cytochrome P450 [Trypanosoma cruzi]
MSCLWTRHVYTQRAQRSPEETTCRADGRQKTAEELPAAYESGRRQPHPFHHIPPFRTGVAPRRRCSIRSFKSPDAIVEKGDGAYLPTTLDCGTTNDRHPCFGPAI